MSDTDFGADRDIATRQGGRNFQSLHRAAAPGVTRAANGATNSRSARSPSAPTAQITGPRRGTDGLIEPARSATRASTSRATPGARRTSTTSSGVCPRPERIGFLGRGTYDFSRPGQGYAELGYTRDRDELQSSRSRRSRHDRLFTPTAAGLRPFAVQPDLRARRAGNPFAANATFTGVSSRPRHPRHRHHIGHATACSPAEVHASEVGLRQRRAVVEERRRRR